MSRHAAEGTDEPAGEPGAQTAGRPAVAGIRVVGGSPTPEELAAVVAVLRAAADEDDTHGRARLDDAPRSAWDASARGLRTPLVRGAGTWTRSLR